MKRMCTQGLIKFIIFVTPLRRLLIETPIYFLLSAWPWGPPWLRVQFDAPALIHAKASLVLMPPKWKRQIHPSIITKPVFPLLSSLGSQGLLLSPKICGLHLENCWAGGVMLWDEFYREARNRYALGLSIKFKD